MTTIMQFVLWVALQFGLPVCDVDSPPSACGEVHQVAGERSANTYSSESRDLRKIWKIYNGF